MMQHRSLAGENTLDVLRLIRTPNVGPVTFFSLMSRFPTAAEALAALPELSRRGGRKTPLTPFGKAEAEREMEQTAKFGARMVMYGATEYPGLLTAATDAPPLITIMGNAQLWQQKQVIAMVGARNASATGCHLAQRLAKDAGDAGLAVASGLARGIDTFVHKGSLASGTIGVIAGGIDNIYPPENQMLYAQIREMGCLVSEQPFGAVPFAGAFPGRNRIIAGMSVGTVVVEASPKSGSLITARLAGEYNRELFAVPGSPLDPRSRGCNQLLKQGATMVENISDILQGIAHMRGLAMQETAPPDYRGDAQSSFHSDTEMERARMLVAEKLGYSPVEIDAVVAQTGCPASLVLAVLLEMELAGRVRRSAGNKIALSGHDAGQVA